MSMFLPFLGAKYIDFDVATPLILSLLFGCLIITFTACLTYLLTYCVSACNRYKFINKLFCCYFINNFFSQTHFLFTPSLFKFFEITYFKSLYGAFTLQDSSNFYFKFQGRGVWWFSGRHAISVKPP